MAICLVEVNPQGHLLTIVKHAMKVEGVRRLPRDLVISCLLFHIN